MLLVSAILIAGAIALLVPIAVLWVECMAALRASQAVHCPPDRQPTLAVLMPAHDEAAVIGSTLKALLPQLPATAQMVVIADNCSDETATVARASGATVIERHDPIHRGKGYALDFGLHYLQPNPPDVVVMVDADCLVHEGAIEQIVNLAATTHRPVQAVYLMERPANSKPSSAISALAFLVKNWVRPTGLTQLGQPCLLTGTGMAFPWEVICTSPLASGNIVEDMQLGLDLAIAGSPPLLCPTARVTGLLPSLDRAATSQRTRWEHGHMQTLLTQVPRLLGEAVRQRRIDLLALALDLVVPPLSLLVMLWLGLALMAALAFTAGASGLPALILAVEGGLMLMAIAAAWGKFGRTMIPAQTLLAIPLYLLWKVPLYAAFLVRRQTKWVRTERDASHPTESV